MKPQRRWPYLLIVLLLWAASGLVQGQAAGTEQLGQVHFPVACSADVQPEFDRAVALLHSFAFDPSAKAFAAVAQNDPSCGMAHWGVAMTRLGNPFNWPPGSQAIIAHRGLTAARRHASIAPAAPQALHMPSHIFTRRGFWQESIDSNRASAASTKNHREKLHAMDYLTYASLPLAQDQAAKRVLDDMHALENINVEHFVSAYALAAMPARYALERRQWAEAAALTLPRSDFPWNHFPQSEAVLVFARAVGAARSGDGEAAREDLARLQELRGALAAATLGYWQEQVEIQHQVVTAWVVWAQGQGGEAVQRMRAAADREKATEKATVTPGPIIPARELLGEMFLAVNEPQQALQAFQASMQIEPNRFWGLYGAARAAELAGDRDKARTCYTQLLALAERADGERPTLAATRSFLAQK